MKAWSIARCSVPHEAWARMLKGDPGFADSHHLCAAGVLIDVLSQDGVREPKAVRKVKIMRHDLQSVTPGVSCQKIIMVRWRRAICELQEYERVVEARAQASDDTAFRETSKRPANRPAVADICEVDSGEDPSVFLLSLDAPQNSVLNAVNNFSISRLVSLVQRTHSHLCHRGSRNPADCRPHACHSRYSRNCHACDRGPRAPARRRARCNQK